jgi:hypothetical protein
MFEEGVEDVRPRLCSAQRYKINNTRQSLPPLYARDSSGRLRWKSASRCMCQQPHLEHRYSRVLYYIQGDTRLLLHTLNPLRHIFSGQERVYALVYPRALLGKRPRGIGDEGLFKSRRCVVHCKSCARLGMSCGSLRLRRAKWRRCGHGSRHGIDAGVRSDRRRVEVHL